MVDALKRQDKAKREHGFKNLKSIEDWMDELHELLIKKGLKTGKEKVDELGFSEGFYRFIGLGIPHDYLYSVNTSIQNRVNDMRRGYALRMDTAQSFYTPLDNMYSDSGTGTDMWYDFGRVPTSHLKVLSSQRIGILFAACNRPATDIMDNGFDFVKRDDQDGDPIKNDNIAKIEDWMDLVQFNKRITEVIEYDARTGLGHLFADKYIGEVNKGPLTWQKKAPNTKPEHLTTFSSYYMTPNNVYQAYQIDYDRQKWNFTGGLHAASNIHHSRMYVYEGIREPMSLRGLALGELCWVANMCYLNLQYYILKNLAQLGVMTVGISIDRDFPTTAETAQYLALLKTFQANNFYVLGRGAQLQIQNVASKIGGIREFMEFLIEDMSAAWVFPKNQLLGRAQGGGLEGAGAIVSKEDYIASNLSVKQSKIKYDIMIILKEMCGFKGLDRVVPRFNIDLHKSSEQRFKEQLMKEQVEQTQMMTEQMKIGKSLYRKQMKLQEQMVNVQLEMMKRNPQKLLEFSNKDEQNLEETKLKKPEKSEDFTTDFLKLKLTYDMLYKQYEANDKLLKYINSDMRTMKNIYAKETEAFRRLYLKR